MRKLLSLVALLLAALICVPVAAANPNPVPPHPGGETYWGSFVSSSTGRTLIETEALIGRQYKIAKDYRNFAHNPIYSATHTTWKNGGRTVFLTVKPHMGSASGNAPCNGDNNTATLCWADIKDGHLDTTLTRIGNDFDKFGDGVIDNGAGDPGVLVAFHHEPEEESTNDAKVVQKYGSDVDYVAAFRRFASKMPANVAMVWNMMGSKDVSGQSDFPQPTDRYPALYAGNDVVDWIAWDPYNWRGCNKQSVYEKTFADIVLPAMMYFGQSNGTYFPPWWGGGKPRMLAEYGSNVRVDSNANWFYEAMVYDEEEGWWYWPDEEDMIPFNQQYNMPEALVYFDADNTSSTGCNFSITANNPLGLEGYKTVGLHSDFNN